jgi:hypothetical protein
MNKYYKHVVGFLDQMEIWVFSKLGFFTLGSNGISFITLGLLKLWLLAINPNFQFRDIEIL